MSLTRLFSLPILNVTHTYSILCRRFYSHKSLNLSDPSVQKYLDYLVLENETILSKENKDSFDIKRLHEIKPIVDVVTQRMFLTDSIRMLRTLRSDESDEDIKQMIKQESDIYKRRDKELDRQLRSVLLEPYFIDGGVLLELTAGEGEHAERFAKKMYNLYIKYAGYKDWDVDRVSVETSSTRGIKKASMLINGLGAHQLMKLEAGIHEKICGGEEPDDYNAQVSTVVVTVLNQPNDVEWNVASCELDIETGVPSKPGAHDQYTDRMQGVRITHIPTGIVVRCGEEDSCERNEEIARATIKTILFQKTLEDQTIMNSSCEGSSSQFSNTNPKKIRTYNFYKHAVTEYREDGGTQYCLEGIMKGEGELENLQDNILREMRYQTLLADIEAVLNQEKKDDDKDTTEEDEDVVYALF